MLKKSLLCLMAAVLITYPKIEDTFVNDAVSVNFTYHSSVKQLENRKFKIANFIRNNRDRDPLSVEWKKGGILAVGFYQIPPRGIAFAPSNLPVEDPSQVGSVIRYGVDLKKPPVQTKVYIDPNHPLEKHNEEMRSEYELRDERGSILVRIQISSSLDEQQQTSDLLFQVNGDISLAVPMKLGGELKSNKAVLESRNWKMTEVAALETLSLRDGSYRDVARDWLRINDQVGYFNYVFLDNLKTPAPNELSVRLSGSRWKLEKVYLIGLNRQRTGMVGLGADVYLPDR